MKIKSLWFMVALAFPATPAWSGEWRSQGEMPIPVSGGQAVVHDSLIYILGGYNDSFRTVIDSIQVYNPRTQEWRTITDRMRARRAWFVAAPYGDSLIIGGGTEFFSDPSGLFGIELWNFINAPSIHRINVNFARRYANGVMDGQNLYLFGGLPSPAIRDSLQLPYIFGYNVTAGREIFREDSLYANINAYDQMLVKQGQEVFIFGGVVISPTNRVLRFRLTDHIFTPLAPQLLEERAGGKAVPTPDNEVYILGGYNEKTKALRSAEIFRSEGDNQYTIRPAPSMQFPRTSFMAVEYEGAIYVFGGEDEFGRPVRAVERLDVSTAVESKNTDAATTFTLKGNYPNPFNAGTTIEFELPQTQTVSLDIYNTLGQHVKKLAYAQFAIGVHRLAWDGRDEQGAPVASGVYVYRLTSEHFTKSAKMLMLK